MFLCLLFGGKMNKDNLSYVQCKLIGRFKMFCWFFGFEKCELLWIINGFCLFYGILKLHLVLGKLQFSLSETLPILILAYEEKDGHNQSLTILSFLSFSLILINIVCLNCEIFYRMRVFLVCKYRSECQSAAPEFFRPYKWYLIGHEFLKGSRIFFNEREEIQFNQWHFFVDEELFDWL